MALVRIFFAEISLADLVLDPNPGFESGAESGFESGAGSLYRSRSLSQWFRSADPDPDQNITEPDPNIDPDP